MGPGCYTKGPAFKSEHSFFREVLRVHFFILPVVDVNSICLLKSFTSMVAMPARAPIRVNAVLGEANAARP
jgi:hypothetical protein